MHITNRLHEQAERKLRNWQSTLATDINIASRAHTQRTAEMFERFINGDIKRITAWYRFITGTKGC